MRRSGFTLMELLVVIGIIMVLLGMLFPAIRLIQVQAQKAKCKTLIMQVVAACDHYRNLNGAHPDSPTMKSVFMPGATPVAATTLTTTQWETVATELVTRLRSVDREHFGSPLEDPWKKVLRYRPVQYYPYTAGATEIIDADPPRNPDSFQVWSTGPNLKDEFGKDSSDDIGNWTKK